MLDASGTGYFIKSGNSIGIDLKNQSSPKETGDGTFTTGNFASAYISHGNIPTNAGYEYVIIPQTTSADMVTFSNNMAAVGTAFYQVVQKNQAAHIVKYNTMYGYSLFSAGNYGTSTPIQSTIAPCLVMTNQTGDNLAMSFVNPDLNFAANNGASQATPIVLTVNGEWNVNTYSGGTANATAGTGITTLTIQAKDGLPVDISLIPAVNPYYPIIYYEDFLNATGNGFTAQVVSTGGATTNILARVSDVPDSADSNPIFDSLVDRPGNRILQGGVSS